MPPVPRDIQLPPKYQAFDLQEVCQQFDGDLRARRFDAYRPQPTGFAQIDACLGGGLRAEDLVLIGGMQNVGKTIVGLEIARNIVARDPEALALMVCYEHGPMALLHRLLCLASIDDENSPAPTGFTRSELERLMLTAPQDAPLDLQYIFEQAPTAERAWYKMKPYLNRLWLVKGDGLETTDDKLGEYVRWAQRCARRVVLVVDYAQRVPLRPMLASYNLTPDQRIDYVMRALKSIGQDYSIPVLAVAAADADGLRQQRIHFENLWGPATVQYEPDVALILNRDTVNSDGTARTVRLSIEKNRHGPSEVEFRHYLHGAHYCLSLTGTQLSAEESYQTERIELRKQQSSGDLAAQFAALLQQAVGDSRREG